MSSRSTFPLSILFLVMACNMTGPRMVDVTVRLTDAPPPTDVASATVWVSKVYLVGTPGQFTINETKAKYDLLKLQNGVTALLGSALIPVGDYEQLRLVVDSARVTLAAGFTFSDGTTEKTLKVPSGGESGLKVNFGGPVHIDPGHTTVTVDFDASQSFIFQGNPTSPNGVLFTPVLHGTVS
jgi:uncharacterized protein DUF4382